MKVKCFYAFLNMENDSLSVKCTMIENDAHVLCLSMESTATSNVYGWDTFSTWLCNWFECIGSYRMFHIRKHTNTVAVFGVKVILFVRFGRKMLVPPMMFASPCITILFVNDSIHCRSYFCQIHFNAFYAISLQYCCIFWLWMWIKKEIT